MRHLFLAALLIALLPLPSNAFWGGLTKEEQSICRKRAARKSNSFSAQQTYQECTKTIKSELKARKKRDKDIEERAKIHEERCPDFLEQLEQKQKDLDNNPPPSTGIGFIDDLEALTLLDLERGSCFDRPLSEYEPFKPKFDPCECLPKKGLKSKYR